MSIDWGSIGPDKQHQGSQEAIDASVGTYKDNAEGADITSEVLPKAPDPSPFKLGPMAPGTREK